MIDSDEENGNPQPVNTVEKQKLKRKKAHNIEEIVPTPKLNGDGEMEAADSGDVSSLKKLPFVDREE